MKPVAINQAWNGTEKCQLCSIRELALFADLKQDDFHLLHRPIKELELKANTVLYEQNNKMDFVYTIRSGMVKLVHYLPNGNYRIIRLLHQGDLAGIEALNDSAYLHHAIALQDTSICQIPVKNIEQLNNNTIHIYKQLTACWQKVQRDADIWLTDLSTGTSRQRVSKLLLYLAEHGKTEESEETFFLPSREDIGALLSITTETASRIIAEFKRTGILTTLRYSAKINYTKLKQIQ